MLSRLIEHHILANITFLLVMVIGWFAYFELPREQDPSVNFNWVEVWTYWPGSAASDVEKRITEPLEEGLKRIQDVKYISSVSRENVSSILIRFEDLSAREFDNRVADLRREVQGKLDDLPEDIQQPEIVEITSANAFPTAMVVAWSAGSGTVLQRKAQSIREDLERLNGVDRVVVAGGREPELQVEFLPERLVGLGLSPVDIADSVSAYFRDLAAGKLVVGESKWLVRLTGTTSDPAVLEQLPVVASAGEIPLRAVADVNAGVEDGQELVRYLGSPAVLYSISKKEKANNIGLLSEIRAYIDSQNALSTSTGVTLALLDDQTASTRDAIAVMERNALIGLALVVLTVGLFLGFRVAVVASIGIPFVLAGTFLVVLLIGQTLNTTVLLAIVISLGMLVDDAVVVVEAISFHLRRGRRALQAARLALSEVALPVATAVFTTIAAFLPLILLPGVLGDFMRVVPVVVSVALLLSLVEAFWMLPSHAVSFKLGSVGGIGGRDRRVRLIRPARNSYTRLLIATVRRPFLSISFGILMLVAAVLAVALGTVKVDFFATDYYRLFYVNIDMPPGTSLDKALETTVLAERRIRDSLEGEVRGIVSYAGQQITDKELLQGDEKGQVFVSLNQSGAGSLTVDDAIDLARSELERLPGPRKISFVRRKTGPPTTKPISIKVRGNDIAEIRSAVEEVKRLLRSTPGVYEVDDDDLEGGNELLIRLNPDAILRSGLRPDHVARFLRLFATGEQVASMQYQGEKLEVRVRAKPGRLKGISDYLSYPISLESGGEIALGELVTVELNKAQSNIRHQDFRRAVTVEAEINTEVTDTLRANRAVQNAWASIERSFPGVSLDFSGKLDDIQESLGSMVMLFLFGVGLIYLILATQFRSYLQPLIVLAAVPMAFVGVVAGLGISGNPLSLFTLYGIVALAGIAANDSIVLIAAANRIRGRNNSAAFAIAHAAKRRFLPIVITSATTIAGLFSLAVGLGGASLMWGPVATAIVWGLAFSTVLTLFVVPALYLTARPRKGLSSPGLSSVGGFAYHQSSWFQRFRRASDALFGGRRERPEDFLRTEEQRKLFDQGLEAARTGDLEIPIKCFERLVKELPDSFELNVLAARANLEIMRERGWDIGYMNRAQRFLGRARSLKPGHPDLLKIQEGLAELGTTEEEGAE